MISNIINENPGLSSGEAKKKVFSQNLSISVVGWLMSPTLDDDLKLILDLLAQERLVVIENFINGVAIKDTDNI